MCAELSHESIVQPQADCLYSLPPFEGFGCNYRCNEFIRDGFTISIE